MMKNKKWILLAVILSVVIVLAFATSYALFRFNIMKNSNFKLAIGNLELTIIDTTTEDKYIMESTIPMKDGVALSQEGYTFTIKNTGTIDSYYTVYLDDIILSDSGDRLDNSYVRFNLLNHETNDSITNTLSNYPEIDRILATGRLNSGDSITYTLRMWVNYDAGNEAQNKYFATQIRVVGTQQNAVGYQEGILNGAYPVLTDNLVPVVISDDGTVTMANIQEEWYSYENKEWANAVVLKEDKTYKNGETIPEDNIESYFVWIPKYSYQLWDLGDYSTLTAVDSTKPHMISIKFGITNTSDSVSGECTTPGTAGASGNCQVGDYMTHPAFLAFDTTGLWVGKFETGYDNATSIGEAQTDVDIVDTSKIIIKSNVYSWRNITVGNMFENSYQYLRDDESHMMKNTEWGAVAYLSHSVYGTCTLTSCSEVRINNNSAYITGYAATEQPTVGNNNGTSIEGNRVESTELGVDGTYTVNYFNSLSNVASTNGNKSGIYDMSGGTAEYVVGYSEASSATGGLSGLIDLYSDFFTNSSWSKYYDKYYSTSFVNYSNRILGDATGEMGPFGSQLDPDESTRAKSSWYYDRADFLSSTWYFRSGTSIRGNDAGVFAFYSTNGYSSTAISYRIVLAPTK